MRMTGTVTSRLRLVDSGNLFFVLVLVLAPALPLLSLSSLLFSSLSFFFVLSVGAKWLRN